MTQATTQERSTAKRNDRADPGATSVSGYALARHFGITRQAVDVLASQGVIERRATDAKFDQDQARLKYIAHLRSDARRSPRTQADADHVKVKTEMLQLRLMEKQRMLVRRDDANELLDTVCGVVLTHLSGMAARCSRDMIVRRNIDAVVHQVRTELAQVCLRMADERGEATAFIAAVALPRRQHRQFVMQGIKQGHYAKHQDEQRGPCRTHFQQFQQFPYDRAFRVHRCEAPFAASAMRPSKLLRPEGPAAMITLCR